MINNLESHSDLQAEPLFWGAISTEKYLQALMVMTGIDKNAIGGRSAM